MKKTVAIVVISIILISTIITINSTSSVYAQTTVSLTIKPDGSITPSTDLIKNQANHYVLTDDIYGTLVIQKDNIVLDGAGHKLDREGRGGFALSAGIRDHNQNPEFVGTNNVVIKNLEIVDYHYGIEVAGSNNQIIGVTLTGGNTHNGVAIWDSGSNTIINKCNIFNNEGIGIYSGNGVIISDNYIVNNSHMGIQFRSAIGKLRNNLLFNNRLAFSFSTFPTSSDIIDVSNIIDGKPVYCWVNEHDRTLPSEAGYVALINCNNITVQGLSVFASEEIKHNSNGINLYSTRDSTIKNNYLQAGTGISMSGQNNIISENYLGDGIKLSSASNISVTKNNAKGISLSSSSDCVVSENTLVGCSKALSLWASDQNRFVQNNIEDCSIGVSIFNSDRNVFSDNIFINNTHNVSETHYTDALRLGPYYESVGNIWDGNYWSTYTGTDSNKDDIGDILFTVYEDKTDESPLMIPFSVNDYTLDLQSISPVPISIPTPFPTTNTDFPVIIIISIIAVLSTIVILVYFNQSKRKKKID